MKKHIIKKGYALVYLLIIIFLSSMMILPATNLLFTMNKVIKSNIQKEQALQIAEAGINYYQWHLAHFSDDFQDGTETSEPYVHDYTDYDTQEKIGKFSLEITPPLTGSTIVTIKSTGWTNDNPNITRTITTKYGIPSLAKYSFLSNSPIWIGPNESVTGQMQSNSGVHFDGVGNAPIQSAREEYVCYPLQGCDSTTTKPGVWGDTTDTIKSFFQFPVPAVDFSSITSDLATIKSAAQSAGIYLAPSSSFGYDLKFRNDGTVDFYKITKLASAHTGTDVNGITHTEKVDYTNTTPLYNKKIPSNGLIYIEDNVWVEGIVKGRALVVAANLLGTAPTIYIPNNITYVAKDGTNVLGLIAQKDIIVTYNAPTNLEIDAAMVAQTGSAQFFDYPSNIKNSITVYGSIMTYGVWTWTWLNGSYVESGYKNTISIYDSNLLYNPPPSFPLSSSGYQQINWISN